jgi:soluble cytochrome b562
VIKSLKNQLVGLINEDKFQDARPIFDSLVDEIRVTVASLPLGTYLATIDEVIPLTEAGNLSEAKQHLVKALDTVVYEEDVTPLSIFRAEDKLNLAFQIAHTEDLSKPENKDKISHLVNEADQAINVAEALGYGTKKDYEPLYKGMDTLKKSIGTSGFEGEWQKFKAALTTVKNKIFHHHGDKEAKAAS